MFLGKVIGSLWSTKKQPQLSGMKFLLVAPIHLSGLPHAECGAQSFVQEYFQQISGERLPDEAARTLTTDLSKNLSEVTVRWMTQLLATYDITLNKNQVQQLITFLHSSGEGVVVTDCLDAGVGDIVLVAFGKAARVAIGDQNMPIEAAIVAIVDEISLFNS